LSAPPSLNPAIFSTVNPSTLFPVALRLLTGLTLAALTAAAAETPASRPIDVDVSAPTTPFNRMTDFCVGAGRANEGLRADWQAQLAEVRRECGFRYLRFHGLFTDDMGVYSVDHKGVEHFNWQYVDVLFDSLLDKGIKPFVELGFMPNAMASGTHTIFWWKGNVTPPKDPAKWEALVRNAVVHWTERYGEAEVATWYFEVWNEPNLSGFWIGDKGGRSDADYQVYARDEYYKLYTVSARAIKSVSAKYRVGGPATAGAAWVPETLAFCAKNGVPIDFISTHNYAVMSGYLDEFGQTGTVLDPNRDAMISQVRHTRKQIEDSTKPGLELHYTEWSTSYTPSDPVHDSYHSAAFILNKLKGIGGAAQSMSYWTFTDIFEEAGPRVTPFHGGFGLLNYQGIRKPSFYAYQFLHKLGENELPVRDPDAFASTDAAGNVQVLFWDFTITHPGPKVNNQDFYNHDLPAKPTAPAELKLTHLKPGLYQLEITRVGYRQNDAYTAYLALGAPAQLTRAQVAELKKASSGAPAVSEPVTVTPAGTFTRTLPLLENDVVLVTLTRR